MARGKSVCVYGAKGGVGKTTFILSLAGILSKLDKKVLIIDLDLSSGAIACSLNREVKSTIFNFSDDYNNNRYNDIEKYITIYDKNISFISAPKDPRQANKIDIKNIDVLIDKCIYMYDVILIDTTHTLNEVNVYALDKADKVLFMTTNDLLSLKNLKNVINIFNDNEINKYKIILNNSLFPYNNFFSNYDIKNILGHNVDYVISSSFNVSKLDKLVLDGDLITYKYTKFKDLKVFNLISSDILGGLK